MAPPDRADETDTPFYVECENCLNCAQQSAWPSEVWVFDEDAGDFGSCRIARQPESEQELYEAVRAVHYSCTQAVRYRGPDPGIQRRLVSIGQQDALVGRVPNDVIPEWRRFATFLRRDGDHARQILRDLLRAAAARHSMLERRWVFGTRRAARVKMVWTRFCPGLRLSLRACHRDQERWVLCLHRPWPKTPEVAVLSMAASLHELLPSLGGDRDVRWYAGEPTARPRPEPSRFPL